jgi:CubicO group peptidase (beta-lactamase class C family)
MKTSTTHRHGLTLGVAILFALFFSSCQVAEEPDAVESNKYDEYLSASNAIGNFNGTALVIEKGEVVYRGAFGIGNIDPMDSLKVESQFRLASVSKQFTAMAIMKLHESGKLDLDQDMRDFIPELAYEGISIRNLLNHVGGLPDYTRLMDNHWKTDLSFDDQARKVSGNDDIIAMMAEKNPPIDFKPLDQWDYSNTGYLMLATVVARASDMPFEDYLKQEIFDPVGMTNTVVYDYVEGLDKEMPNRVFGFSTSWNGVDQSYQDSHYLNAVQGDGGIYSTVDDLAKWDRALYTDKLVSPDLLEEAFTPVILNNGDTTTYGFGWGIGESFSGKKVVSHSGGWVGFATFIHREIEEDNCFIILTNNSGNGLGGAVAAFRSIMHDQPYDMPTTSIATAVAQKIQSDGIEQAIEHYHFLKKESEANSRRVESELNQLGYNLMAEDLLDEAIAIFKLNRDENPETANCYDSLGDGLLAKGDTTNAIITFHEALEMDSTLTFILNKINDLEGNVAPE